MTLRVQGSRDAGARILRFTQNDSGNVVHTSTFFSMIGSVASRHRLLAFFAHQIPEISLAAVFKAAAVQYEELLGLCVDQYQVLI